VQQNKPAEGLIRCKLPDHVLGLFIVDCYGSACCNAQELSSCTEVANPLSTVEGGKLVIAPAACVDCLGVVFHDVYLDWIKKMTIKTEGFFFVWRLRAIRGVYLDENRLCRFDLVFVLRFSFTQLLDNLNDKRRSEKATNCNG